MLTKRPSFKHSRPAPRRAPGAPPNITDDVTWTRILETPERYRIEYADRDSNISVREILLQKLGHSGDFQYIGVLHQGKFKTMRVDRIGMVTQLSTGHPCSLKPQPTYSNELPRFPVVGATYKVPTNTGRGTWTVDLNKYTCTCPEKRIRSGHGYTPGQLGYVCSHMARAILDHLPRDAGWDPELLTFLGDPRKVHIENLT